MKLEFLNLNNYITDFQTRQLLKDAQGREEKGVESRVYPPTAKMAALCVPSPIPLSYEMIISNTIDPPVSVKISAISSNSHFQPRLSTKVLTIMDTRSSSILKGQSCHNSPAAHLAIGTVTANETGLVYTIIDNIDA